MEQNLPIIVKKIWKMAKVIYFMLRKGISKRKLLSALNIMMKRGKIAGKEALQNLIFHHHHHAASVRREYEFSCGDSPAHRVFHLHGPQAPKLRRRPAAHRRRFNDGGGGDGQQRGGVAGSVGVRPSPIVRQLKITDSPFPLRDVEENIHVDEAGEEFILKFYKDLRQQNSMAYLS